MVEQRAHAHLTLTDFLLLLMAAIWAVNFSVVKYGTHSIEPLAFTGMRVGMSAILLLGIAGAQRRPWPERRDVYALLALGVIGNGVYQLLFVEGVSRTRAGNAALIVAAAPGFIAVASRLRGIERASWRVLSGIALSIAGVGLVVLGSANATQGDATFLGAVLVFCGVLCWAVYTVGLQPLTRRVDPIQLSGIAMTGGTIPLLFTTPVSIVRMNWSAVPVGGWIALLYSSVVSMVIGYLFWYRGLRTLGPTRTAAYSNLQPMIALATAWAMLGEVPTLWQWIGVITITAGVLLTRS